MLETVDRLFMLVSVLLVMLGLGATQTLSELRSLWRTPRAIVVGLVCQFGIMPLLGFGLAKLFALPPAVAIGLILLGCSPGGLSSNILTYFARGNVGLSIVMTLSSTVVAVGMMPLCTWLYASGYTSASLQIPYGNLGGGLVLMLIPLSLGLWIRAHHTTWAKRLEKLASRVGILVFVFLAATWFPKHGHLINMLTWGAVLAPICITALGYGLGYVIARVLALSPVDARTVSLETGTQNSVLTITMIGLSFSSAQAAQLLIAPVVYLIAAMLIGWGVTLAMRTQRSREASLITPGASV